MADCLNPEGSDSGTAKAAFRDVLDKIRIEIRDSLVTLWAHFQPKADAAIKYNPGLCDYFGWHLSEAIQLICKEPGASDDEWSELTRQIIEVADRITSAGTNPTEFHLLPKLAGYDRHWQKQQRFEWSTLKPYQSVLQRPTTLADLDASIRKLTDVVNDSKARPAARVLDEPFVLTRLQEDILAALDGRAMTKQPLADAACGSEGSRLYKSGGIKELMSRDLVKNKRGVGYYRPNSPPPSAVN